MGLPPLLLDRHALLTIRNLTARRTDRMFNHGRDYSEENSFPRNTHGFTREKNSDQRKAEENLDHRRSFRELARAYFAIENSLEFALEALFFAIIVAISAWPILTAAGALNQFFQNTPV